MKIIDNIIAHVGYIGVTIGGYEGISSLLMNREPNEYTMIAGGYLLAGSFIYALGNVCDSRNQSDGTKKAKNKLENISTE